MIVPAGIDITKLNRMKPLDRVVRPLLVDSSAAEPFRSW